MLAQEDLINCYLQTSNKTILYNLEGLQGRVTFALSEKLAQDNYQKIKSESWNQLAFCGVRITVPKNYRVVINMKRKTQYLNHNQIVDPHINIDNEHIFHYAPLTHNNSYFIADKNSVIIFKRLYGHFSGYNSGYRGIGFNYTVFFFASHGFELAAKNRTFGKYQFVFLRSSTQFAFKKEYVIE